MTNVVVMGMGEPFLNYDETMRACRLLNDPDGFGLAARAALGVDGGRRAGDPALRRRARCSSTWPSACTRRPTSCATAWCRSTGATRWTRSSRPAPTTSRARRRKLFFEYVVLAGVNDGDEQVKALVSVCGVRSTTST